MIQKNKALLMFLASLVYPAIALIIFLTSKNPIVPIVDSLIYTLFIWFVCIVMLSIGKEIGDKQ